MKRHNSASAFLIFSFSPLLLPIIVVFKKLKAGGRGRGRIDGRW